MLKTYIFTTTHKEYYKVTAYSKERAKQLLESCDDLTTFNVTQELQTLEDTQPEFEYYGEVD